VKFIKHRFHQGKKLIAQETESDEEQENMFVRFKRKLLQYHRL